MTHTRNLLISLLLFPLCATADFSLWGSTPQNHIGIGSFAWHVQDTFGNNHAGEPHYMMYPYVSATYDSANVLYFKNTYQRSTVGLTVERDLYNTALNKDFALNFNYQIGALFAGYCIRSLSCEPPSARVIPIGIISSRISYKDRIGFTVSVFGVVVVGSFQYLF